MASLKPYFPHIKKDGTIRVIIRLHHNNMRKLIRTEIFITPLDLTKKGKIKSPQIQNEIDEILIKYRQKLQVLGSKVTKMSIDEVLYYLTIDSPTDIDFIQYSKKLITNFRNEGKAGMAINYTAAINSFRDFVQQDHFPINMVTGRLMQQYAEYLSKASSKRYKNENRPIGGRALSLYSGIFRAIINKAKDEFNDEDLDIITVKVNPFRKFKVPVAKAPEKRALTKEKVILIRDLQIDPANKRANIARDCFMLSFYLIGINSIDLFETPSIRDGRIEYERKKTRSRRQDNAFISVKVEPEALEMLKKYDFKNMYSSPNNLNHAINIGLKQIGEMICEPGLTYYAARHSWATIAANDCKIDKYIVHQALNHVDETMKITEMYIKKDWSHLDRANRTVLDYLLIE